MRKLLVLLSVAVLSGCAPTVVGSNEAGGVVNNVRTEGLLNNMGDAYNMANAQCARYGKIARINSNLAGVGSGSSTLSFDCVTR